MDLKHNIEIERKFLVNEMPDVSMLRAISISQGYVTQAADSVEVRLRKANDEFFMTLKSKGTVTRQEYEISISRDSFEALWPATEARRFEKTRYVGHLDDGHIFELDVFDGALAPLMLVEVEFKALDSANAFVPPDWFGADVSSDATYKGKSLAMIGSSA